MNTKVQQMANLLACCPGSQNRTKVCKTCPCILLKDCDQALKREVVGLLEGDRPAETATPYTGLERVRVTKVLHLLGVPAHIKGYGYVREAIMMAVQTPEVITAITKTLYPQVAKMFATTPSRVERAIRHAIEVTWDRGDLDVLQNYFGNTINAAKGKPTNSEFIALVADTLLVEQEYRNGGK